MLGWISKFISCLKAKREHRRELKAWKKLKVQEIIISKEAYEQLMEELEREPEDCKALRKLFQEKGVFDED